MIFHKFDPYDILIDLNRRVRNTEQYIKELQVNQLEIIDLMRKQVEVIGLLQEKIKSMK